MFVRFLQQQWKEFWRGRNKSGNIIARIVMIFLVLYLILSAIAVGLFMKELIEKTFPGEDPVHIFNGFVLYYFLIDLITRIQIQELPALSIKPYLTINIRKQRIVNFLNAKTLFSFFNLIPLFVFLPFCFTEVAGMAGILSTLSYVISIVSLIIFNNFLALYLKRKGGTNGWITLVSLAIVLSLAALDYFHIISVRDFSGRIFTAVLFRPYLAAVFVLPALGSYIHNSRFLYSNLYLEELSPEKQTKAVTDYPFLNRFGKAGELAALELKLVLRHKRSKSALIMGFIFVFYGFLFYRRELLINDRFASMMFAAIFMTGIFQIVYGQFMFAWQSGHFDGLMANRISSYNFIKAKFLLFTLAATFITLLTLFYGFISWKLIVLHIVIYLYNIGFGSVIVLFFACYNRKRLDLSKGSGFNWQGTGLTQWILALPLILIPFLIYWPFGANDSPFWGLIAIGIFGLISLAMRDMWIGWITGLFDKQRYKIAEGFRE